MTAPAYNLVPEGIRNPERWVKRKAERGLRRDRTVNYPVLEPGNAVLARRRQHGATTLVLSRDKFVRRSKYEPGEK